MPNKQELLHTNFTAEQQSLSDLENPRSFTAIILAGGLGTRLRAAVLDLPKCMAPVSGHPFLYYVINYLRLQNVQHFIFSLGYKSNLIIEYLKHEFPTLNYSIAMEEEPLGTGGAIQLALQHTNAKNVLIANGDTLFKIKVADLFELHQRRSSECTLSLKPLENFDRYGVLELAQNGQVLSFKEKQFFESGLINGGLYLVNKEAFLARSYPEKFSFEKDYLEKYFSEGRFFGCPQNGYFIDIGIPKDFNQAQIDLAQKSLNLSEINASWTLFLDRDGVLNNELPGTYVLNKNQFTFSDGVLDSIKTLSDTFGKLIVVTNQRGIDRGLMTEEDLLNIHQHMLQNLQKRGGRIDAIFYCPDVENDSFNRKPNPGAAVKALKLFPQIDLSKSIMVGNTFSDMAFGRAAGMHTVFISSTLPAPQLPHKSIDLVFSSLAQFAAALQS